MPLYQVGKPRCPSNLQCVQLTNSLLVHLNIVIFSSDCYLITFFCPALLVYDLLAERCHKMSEGDYVGRVGQVDAFDFDTEILEQV